jgi:MFS family permease
MTQLGRRESVVVFLVFAFTYFLSALLRGVTATLAPELTQEFGLNASELGLLAGGYFLGFSLTQLPLGAWLDRHGPRLVVLGFLIAAVASCAAFALAHTFAGLLAARVLCGIGLSACFMAPLTGFRRWLEPAAQLRANSWMLMSGSLGMVASTLPVQWLVPVVGWRPLFWGLGLALAVAMVLLTWTVPTWKSTPGGPHGSYKDVLLHPYFRRMSPIGFFCYGGLIAMQALWCGPWLVRVANYPPLQAAQGLFIINVCMLCTFWAWGWVNPWCVRRGLSAERLIAWGQPLSFVLLLGVIVAGPAAGAWSWAVFCISSTFVALAQPSVGMAFPAQLSGRALSAYNLMIFAGTFVIQWGVGALIDAFLALGWGETNAFRGALAVFLGCCVMSYGYFVLAKDNSSR